LRDLRGGRVAAVGRGLRRLGRGHPGWQEQQAERVAELSAHHAVQYEIDGRVDQGQHVHDLAHVLVAVLEEPFAQQQREQAEYALRELGDQEQHKHGQQHPRGPVRLPLLVGRLAPRAGQLGPTPFRLQQRADQPQAEHRERHARQDLDDHAVHPEVDVSQVRGRGQVTDVHVVQRNVAQRRSGHRRRRRPSARGDAADPSGAGAVDRAVRRRRSVARRVQRFHPGEQVE